MLSDENKNYLEGFFTQKTVRSIANGRHVLIEGAGHGDELFVSSPKIKDVMLEFMRGVPLSTYKITLPVIKFQLIQSKE